MASTDTPEDPYFWTVDELIYELCHNPQPVWVSQAKRALMPASDMLEQSIRDNVLDGESFMSMGMSEIADELKISAYGPRRNIYKIVKFFRSISAEYRRQNIFEQVMPYINGVESPQITTSHLSGRPQSVVDGNQTHLQAFGSPRLSNGFASTPAQWPGFNPRIGTAHHAFCQSTPGEGTPRMKLNLKDAAEDSGFHDSLSEARHIPQVGPSLQGSVKEPTFQGSSSEQRQFLEVTVSGSRINKATPQTQLHKEPVLPASTTLSKKRKRVAPTFVSHIPLDRATTHRPNPSDPQSMFIDDIETAYEFALTTSRKPSEARKNVASTMKTFLLQKCARNRPRQADSHTQQRHRHKDVVEISHPNLSVEQNDNPFLVEEKQPLEEGELETTPDPSDLPDELAQLLANNPTIDGELVYAVFGDSDYDAEEDQKDWDEMEAEVEAEMEEDRRRMVPPGVLTEVEVNTAIDDAIQDMVFEWQMNVFPKVQQKGYRKWNKATREQNRPDHIADSDFWLKRFEKSIGRLRAAIGLDTWHKATDVKSQCRSLEESVFQREEHKYYLAILQSNEPPQRPDWQTLSRAKNAPRPEVPEGEELLEESSDDGFIEDDTSETGSIPNEAPSTKLRPADPEAPSESEIPATDSYEVEGNEDPVSVAEAETPAMIMEHPTSSDHSSIDSDDEIMSSARRRPLQISSVEETAAPSRKLQLSQRQIDTSDESGSDLESNLDAPAPLPPSRYRKQGTTEHEPIVLISSPSAPSSQGRNASTGSIRTPSLNPDPASSPSSCTSRQLRIIPSSTDGPSIEDVNAIRELDWETIEDDQDHQLALAKAVYTLGLDFATKLHNYLEKVAAHKEKRRACELLKSAVFVYGREEPIDGVAKRDQDLAHCLGPLFVTYSSATYSMDQEDVAGKLGEAYDAVEMGCQKFYTILNLALKAYCEFGHVKKRAGKKRNSDDIDLRDELDNDSDLLMETDDRDQENVEVSATRSAKKRKKKVIQSQEAETQQLDDRARVAEQEHKRAAMLQRLKDMEDNADGDLDGASLHPVSFDLDAPTIYLDPHIGSKVKPHQENGIQFMWREITAGKGCMLAHTMGLGKTMQVISLLITIAQASHSDDLEIKAQVPESLRESQTLILAPPTLVDNWQDEILMWTPKHSLVLGDVRKIAAATKAAERMMHIKHWARDGGILLMSYSIFKQIVEKKSEAIPEEYRQKYSDLLTSKPSVVVADEAHHMKNPKSSLAKAAKQFTTKARIALTGSPLSNHLEEYHQMVDWVSPGYLGTLVQFKAKYSEPIKEGLYSDSTSYERRLSSRKLIVLKRDLEPKICRADISAIAKDMPKKAEFFITIPLTAVQREAYSKYAKHMLRDHDGGTYKQTKIWSWLGVLSLLLNHPSPFVHKLEDGNPNEVPTSAREREVSVDTDDLALPADVPVSDSGLSSEAIQDILSSFSTMTPTELEEVEHSYRSILTTHIIEESRCIEEKVLIFSHSIPTLNYLERLLKRLGCTYARIDGSTSMSTRQDMVKDFNKQKDVEAMLISTTAGGLGLNLQGANRVIIYDFNFNPTWEEQAIGRAYRLGQSKPVFVYRFRAGGTFEETVYNMSIFKTQLFARVVDKRNPMRFASKKLSDYLFPPRDVEQAELTECVGKDPKVLDRVMMKETCIRKVELTETFQVEEDDELTPEELEQAEAEYQDEVLSRTDPAKLAELQAERYRQSTQQDQIRPAEQQQHEPRTLIIQRSAPTRFLQPAYPQLPGEQRYSNLAGTSGVPQMQFGILDDMQLDPVASPRARANSIACDITQVDGSDDKPISCETQ